MSSILLVDFIDFMTTMDSYQQFLLRTDEIYYLFRTDIHTYTYSRTRLVHNGYAS